MRLPLNVSAAQLPIKHSKGQVYEGINQGVYKMEEAYWDRVKECVNHHEHGIEGVLGYIVQVDWFVFFIQHCPVPYGH